MMPIFYTILLIIVLQRIFELFYARRNEKKMKQKGALEFGAGHYKWIVLLHVLFFVALLVEVHQLNGTFGIAWPLFLFLFIMAQIVRIWALKSLGPYWNTKIIVLPGAEKIALGPYRFLPHPNYLVVAIEILALPLIFGAWRTALIFTVANALLLIFVRIPAEEQALEMLKTKR
ncbi:isoprenylcysteine carboxyl methyltransferase family protein [Planococcus sp. SSTMD024]|uniref:isoprenylcysteine carboxyl methyltransferase family protein n=1 Tax=Planococcus sp. SSTMD024 TaxID=3242163 RepID=UPI00351F5428